MIAEPDVEIVDLSDTAEVQPVPVDRWRPSSKVLAAVAATCVLVIGVAAFVSPRNAEVDEESPTTSAQQYGREAAASTAVELVVLEPSGIIRISLRTSEEVSVELPEPATGSTIARLGEAIVYVGASGAWAVPLDESEPIWLGRATLVKDAAHPRRVWIGVDLPAEVDLPERVSWSEVDLSGGIHRATVREVPLDFAHPDLVWGFNSSIYRLTDAMVHPWRYIKQGFPLAVGANDLIVNVCTSDRRCHREWYDSQTGQARGPVLDDVAESLVPRYGAVLSPDGRYVLGPVAETGELGLWETLSGERLDHFCLEPAEVGWATRGDALACRSKAGLVVHDLQRPGQEYLVRDEGRSMEAFLLVETPTR